MLIEFVCTNLSEYDAAKGRYTECGNRLVVSEEKIGEQVKCDRCNEMVEVPMDSIGGGKRPQAKQTKKRPAVAATKPVRSKPKPGIKRVKKKSNELQLEAPIQRQPADVIGRDFSNVKSESTLAATDSRFRCPKCGGTMNNGRCSECRYVAQKFETQTMPLDEIPVQLAGFQKWFCEILSEGVSISLLVWVMHLGVLVFAIVCLALAVLSMPWGILLAVVTIVGSLLYVGLIYQGYQFTTNPRAKMTWFLKPFWNMVLMFCRMMNWQAYDSRYKGRGIISKRGAPIVDEKIPEIENLHRCQVLDLEKTLITDNGLRHLYGLQHLSCLVLRKTSVTHEGVFRLQQSNPKLWIWY